MWQKKNVRLVNRVGGSDIKLGSRDVSRGGEIHLPKRVPAQPFFRAASSETLAASASFLMAAMQVTLGAVINLCKLCVRSTLCVHSSICCAEKNTSNEARPRTQAHALDLEFDGLVDLDNLA